MAKNDTKALTLAEKIERQQALLAELQSLQAETEKVQPLMEKKATVEQLVKDLQKGLKGLPSIENGEEAEITAFDTALKETVEYIHRAFLQLVPKKTSTSTSKSYKTTDFNEEGQKKIEEYKATWKASHKGKSITGGDVRGIMKDHASDLAQYLNNPAS